MGEVLKINQIAKNKIKINANEINWMHSFNFSANDIEASPKKLEIWEIRLDKSQFGNWMKERKMFKLFFDGASKGNPGKAKGGGVIICPEGNIEVEYFWNIGLDSNNMAEAYGLWQGIKQLKEKGVEEAIVFVDSRSIIQALNGASQSRNLRLDRMVRRIKSLIETFWRLEYFHILRELNDLADQAANKEMGLSKNELSVNLLLSSAISPYD